MPTATVTTLPGASIQGEQQARNQWVLMSPGDVDLYIDTASREALICREAGHDFPTIAEAGIRFDFEPDSVGLSVRRLRCKCCGVAWRVEKWDRVGRGRNARWQQVGTSHIEYPQPRSGEPQYLAPPGLGRITRRRMREAMATRALAGQTPAQARRAAAHDTKEQKAQ